MDKGLSFTYNTTAFPRYHFFQQRLQRLVPRWQKILDAGGLPDCKSQGKVKLKEISAGAQQVTDKITVNVFADSSSVKKRKFDLPKQSPEIGNVVIEKLKWSGYFKERRKTNVSQPTFIVVVVKSVDLKSFDKVHKELVRLPEPHLKEVIIYNDQTNRCHLYTDLVTGTDVDSKPVEHSVSLREMIQYMLEEKVITVLELITDYNHEFIPRQEEEVDSSLLDSIHLKLIQSLQDPFIVSDLAPGDGAPERVPSDPELHQIAEVIGTNWETLGIMLGVTNLEIQNIKTDHRTVALQTSHMLLTWKKKSGNKASLKDLHQTMEQLKIDTSALKTLFGEGMTDVERDEIFHKKLTDFIAKKTKCVCCDILSKRYGISASLVNEFLNVGFFDYEKQVIDLLKTINLPKWPRDKSDSGVSTCRVFSYRCAMSMTKIIHSAEDYIKVKLKILTVLKKLQFEIFGQLLQAKIPVQVAIPELPKLPLELQYELLRLEEVTGCGICYGDLLLHVKKNLFPAKKEEIRELLHQYKYVGGFKSQLMEEKEKTEQALGLLLEQGQELRAKKEGGSGHSYGSLGCFVRIKPKIDPRGVSQTQAGAMVSTGYAIQEEKDHCITCAHCLRDCEPAVEVRGGSSLGYSRFGTKKCYLYQPEALDVASVQVFDDKLNNCDSKLKRSDRVPVETWRTFEVDPIRRDVHKEGCSTRFTRGLVMSTNYMTERMMDYNIQRFQATGSLEDRFNPSFNILIESLPGEGDVIENVLTGEPVEPFQVHPFSQDGDSGSVIIADDEDDTGRVNVVALLLGAVEREKHFLHSYGSLMLRMIEEVEEQYNCIVTPTRLPPGGHVLEGAVGGGAVLQGQLQ